MESLTNISGELPTGLSLTVSNGEGYIQGTPTKLTLNTNFSVIKKQVLLQASNQSGAVDQVLVDVAVHPIYNSGNLSPNIVAETNAEASSNNSNYLGEMYSPTNMPFASGGMGTFEDPVIIGIGEYSTFLRPQVPNFSELATNILGFAIDFNGTPLSH